MIGKIEKVHFRQIWKHEAKVELYIDKDKDDGRENKAIFDQIYRKKEAIEQEMDTSLSWERLDNKRALRIAVYFTGLSYKDEEKWDESCEKMVEAIIKFEKSLGKIIGK